MQESTKLTPELEVGISRYEEMEILVSGPGSRDNVISLIKEVKSIKSRVIAFFKDSKENSYRAWKAVCANEKTFTDRLDGIEKDAKNAVVLYDIKQEDIRRKEQARLQAIEDERVRKERERLEKHADKLKTPERAEALRMEAEAIVAPTVQVAEPEKTEGVSSRKIWRAKVTDLNSVPREWMVVNEKALEAFAKSTKGVVPVAGVEFYPESILSVKS